MENIKIEYYQEYIQKLDITVIIKEIHQGEKIIQKISGFYYGVPSLEGMEQFKDKNEARLD